MAKRALILAGGGLKVCFQAGVLQVWLDEAGLTFDHADGASGGCFNLAMYCQGMSGQQMADNWRNLDPFLPVDVNAEAFWRFGSAQSLFTYDNFRKRVLPFWKIDWQKINQSPRLGTFNISNYSKKRLDVFTQQQLTEDLLVASVSLPMWFPPVVINGDRYIDSVYITDANVEEAIRRGADEIWAIWTVSTRDEWRNGFVAQYFHVIETVADTNFFGIWKRIEASNAKIAAGQAGEFGRPITLKLLQAEVPVHYLFNFSKDRMAEAVNMGVKAARDWCDQHGVPLPNRGADIPPPAPVPVTRLQFTEEMKGFVAAGQSDFKDGEGAGKKNGSRLSVKLTIKVSNVDQFVTDPAHRATVEGTAEGALLGGKARVESGTFNLLVQDGADPGDKQMLYRLVLRVPNGTLVTLDGFKNIRSDSPFDAWDDTTTLFTTLYQGEGTQGARLGTGIIRIEFLDFMRQLTTFRVEGPTVAARTAALARFGQLFLGKLWDVYGRDLSPL